MSESENNEKTVKYLLYLPWRSRTERTVSADVFVTLLTSGSLVACLQLPKKTGYK
jgi:hypothetical protein